MALDREVRVWHWTGRSGCGIGQGGQGVALDREVRVWHWTGRSGCGIGQGGQGVALDREVRVWHWTGRSGCGIGQGGQGMSTMSLGFVKNDHDVFINKAALLQHSCPGFAVSEVSMRSPWRTAPSADCYYTCTMGIREKSRSTLVSQSTACMPSYQPALGMRVRDTVFQFVRPMHPFQYFSPATRPLVSCRPHSVTLLGHLLREVSLYTMKQQLHAFTRSLVSV